MNRVIGQTIGSNVVVGVEEFNPNAYIVEVDTAFGTNNNQIALPVQGTNMTIDWGDGTISTGVNQPNTPSSANAIVHNYGGITRRFIQVSGGLQRVNWEIEQSSRHKVVAHVQWGTINWTTMGTMYGHCPNLKHIYDNTSPNLALVEQFNAMFRNNTLITDWSFLSNWNTQTVNDFLVMFIYTPFNLFLGNWDIRSAAVFQSMFTFTSMTPENYTDTFVAWANQTIQRGTPINVNAINQWGMTFVGSRSGGANFANALAARTWLTTPVASGGAGWSINGDTVI